VMLSRNDAPSTLPRQGFLFLYEQNLQNFNVPEMN